MKPHILIVDDEPNVRFVLERTLRHEGYSLDTATDGAEALIKLAAARYHLLLLDLHMEPVGGLPVLRAARTQDPDLVIIILTAHGSLESAVEALRLGAFDYLFKPANPEVIRQRVQEGLSYHQQAVRHRHLLGQLENLRQILIEPELPTKQPLSPPAAERRFVRSGPLVIDTYHRLASLNDQGLDLTTTEFDILLCLVEAAPKPMSPRLLIACALGYNSDEVAARDLAKWHVHRLRHKIEPDPAQPHYIQTVRHKGYLWRKE